VGLVLTPVTVRPSKVRVGFRKDARKEYVSNRPASLEVGSPSRLGVTASHSDFGGNPDVYCQIFGSVERVTRFKLF
jgi:hypothetical protein